VAGCVNGLCQEAHTSVDSTQAAVLLCQCFDAARRAQHAVHHAMLHAVSSVKRLRGRRAWEPRPTSGLGDQRISTAVAERSLASHSPASVTSFTTHARLGWRPGLHGGSSQAARHQPTIRHQVPIDSVGGLRKRWTSPRPTQELLRPALEMAARGTLWFPGVAFEITSRFAGGPAGVMEWIMRGAHRGDFSRPAVSMSCRSRSLRSDTPASSISSVHCLPHLANNAFENCCCYQCFSFDTDDRAL
jgi:hypothetical protein